MSSDRRTLAFVGGTGKEGRGLGLRLAAAGHRVLIGSRSEERAASVAAELRARLEHRGRPVGARLEGLRNVDAIGQAAIVFLTLPFAALDELLAGCGALLAGRIVVDVMNPLRYADGRFEPIPVAEGSASARVQRLVPGARVVAGFKNASAEHLLALDRPAEGDILLAADDPDAKAAVAELVRDIPALRPVDAGPLANAGLLECVTALELNLNRLHKARTSIRILGIDPGQ